MPKEFFPFVKQIKYEGKDSRNPLAFKYYNENQVVAGKTMKEHLRFAVAWWHTFCGTGADPFGPGTRNFPWMKNTDAIASTYRDKMDAKLRGSSTKIGVCIITAFMILILHRKGKLLPNRKVT